MRIPDHKIDEVRSANDIIDVIGAFVRLKKRGKNHIGLCPFHQEKTPSFTVSADKQMYHCFGCGKGGNVFTFVMEMEKVSFIEAVRSLAERAGIQLPAVTADTAETTETDELLNACRFAGNHFYKNLTESPEGKPALQYFHGRGFSDETIRNFGLGYSLNSWEGLLRAAGLEGIPTVRLLKAGLLRQREDGSGYYDYFRGRAMFPILTTTGRVVAFGARKMRDDDPIQGKYINSPETPIYSKSRILFGLFHSKEAIRSEENALMVEGYADAISLFQAGIENVVASSGTALTEGQVSQVGRYTRTLTLVYDADSAGSQAALRGMDLVLEQGLDVKIVSLPPGEDPDSFVRKQGAKEFRKLLGSSVSFIDFKADQFLKAGRFATAEGKTEAVRSIVQSIAKIKDELKRNFFVKEVAEKYEIQESVLHRELDRWVSRERLPARPVGFKGERPPVPQSAQTSRETGGALPAAERDILKILLENQGDVAHFVASNLRLDDLTDSRIQRLAQMALKRIQATGLLDAGALVNDISDPELKSIVTDVMLSRYEISRGWQDLAVEIDEANPRTIAKAAILAVRRHALRKQIEENQRNLRDASQRGDETRSYIQRHQEILRMLKELETQKTE